MITRRLAAIPQSTCQKAAIYLARRAPRKVASVSARYLGVAFNLDLRDNLQRDLYYLGRYENDLLDFLLREIRAGDVFVDIGAHIGTFALPVARRLAGTGCVIAFEPAPDTAAALERNARENGIECVTVVCSALGPVPTIAHLRESSSGNYSPQDRGVRSLHGEGRVVADVPVIPFDKWAAEFKPPSIDVVKIDVEGSEYGVLEGMQESLQRYQPRLIVIEVVEGHLSRSGVSAAQLEALASTSGYRAHGPRISELASSRVGPFWPNAVLRRGTNPIAQSRSIGTFTP